MSRPPERPIQVEECEDRIVLSYRAPWWDRWMAHPYALVVVYRARGDRTERWDRAEIVGRFPWKWLAELAKWVVMRAVRARLSWAVPMAWVGVGQQRDDPEGGNRG